MTTPSPGCETCCPLCGGPNRCSMALTGKIDPNCWCREVHFPRELLAQVPEPLRGRACICRSCVERATTTASSHTN